MFVILGIWLWRIADMQTHFLPLELKVVSILGIIFFCTGVILLPIRLFDKRPGLVIDNDGIIIYSGFSSELFISWKNIVGFEVVKMKSTRLLLVFINNTEEMINQESMWKRESNETYFTAIWDTFFIRKRNFKV